MCPTFLRKCAEHDMKNPENQLSFFPSIEPWTWEVALPSGQRTAILVGLAEFVRPNRNGKMQQTQLPFQPRQIALNRWELKCHSWDRQESDVTNEWWSEQGNKVKNPSTKSKQISYCSPRTYQWLTSSTLGYCTNPRTIHYLFQQHQNTESLYLSIPHFMRSPGLPSVIHDLGKFSTIYK